MRWRRSRAEPLLRNEGGAAVVDFVLVSLVLVPLFLGIIQVALVMHVRTTLASAAAEGARYAATVDRGPREGAARARAEITQALSARYARGVRAREEVHDGVRVVVVEVSAAVPPLGLWGPGLRVHVVGHGLEEPG
ncbi:MAG: TadE/TadG family type IV pilus assembly protein [Marmoricola sp.]